MIAPSTSTRTTALRSSPAATPDDRWPFSKGTRSGAYRDEVLFSEGDAALFAYRIVSGTVRIVKVMIDGRRHILDFLLPGDFVGLDCVATYGFTAEALTDLVWIGYSRAWIDREREERAGLERRLHELALERLATAQNQMLLLGRMTARERLAAFLLNLDRRLGVYRDTGGVISLAMTRMDIADHLGLTLETVSRSFNQLKREGIIDLPRPQRVLVVDSDGLQKLASGSCNEVHPAPVESGWHVPAMLRQQSRLGRS